MQILGVMQRGCMSEVLQATRSLRHMGSVAVVLLVANLTVMPMDCEQVRALVLQYGRVKATAWAVEQMAIGTYSWKDLRAAKRCLDAPRGRG